MIKRTDNSYQDLISSAQTLTGSWAALGDVVDVRDSSDVALYLKVVIGDSQNVRIRALAKRTESDSEAFSLPIKTTSASVVAVEAEYFELNVDSNQSIVIPFNSADVLNFIQFQVMAGTAGASPGNIAKASVSFSSL
jgi:hypothetical protein